MTSLFSPDASIVSAASTVTEFFMPDTVRLLQWPVIVMVLEMPLTVTVLSLQASVSSSLMPEMLSGAPAGAPDVPDAVDGVDGALLGVRVLVREDVGPVGGMLMLGVGD